ncbi:hypothetical protein [Blautia producta]|uniref:hypothetical protein n=1 Tax=Blautia producta TaxID=33035 RepID=UPI001F335AE6|nr:hypothetical protein [Blautia producta]
METIISACISAGVTLIVCLISNKSQQEKTRALMEYKLEELTKKVEKHNSVVERTYILEEKIRLPTIGSRIWKRRYEKMNNEEF